MARVVCWLAQSAGPDVVRAGWPGSNGSVIGTNALEVLGDGPAGAALDDPAAALALPPAALVADVVACAAPASAGELAVLQPASRPIPTAAAAVSTSFTPAVACLPP